MTRRQFRFGSAKGGGSSIALIETLNDETPEQRRNAALTICDRAESVDDARALLQALGLVGYDGNGRRWDMRGSLRPQRREGSL